MTHIKRITGNDYYYDSVRVGGKPKSIYRGPVREGKPRSVGTPTPLKTESIKNLPEIKKDEHPGIVEFPSKEEFAGDYNISITIPSTVDTDKPIPIAQHDARVREIQKWLTAAFGGGTNVAGEGTYVSTKKGEIVAEEVKKVSTTTTEKDFASYDLRLKEFLEKKKKEWDQESLSVEVNGKMYLV